MDTFVGVVFCIVVAAIAVIPFFQIFRRTGHSGWWAFLILVPIVNIVVIWIIAFARWPAVDRS
jgi:uncharacterized membrane protein YraQ (UPF0718 family)